VRREPRSAAAWGELAETLQYNDIPDLESVRACYLEAARLDPNDPTWPYLLGTMLQRSDHDAALPQLRQAAALARRADRNNPTPLLTLAEQLLADGALDEAEAFVQQAAGIDEHDARVQYDLGVLALRRDRPRDAVGPLRRAAESPDARQKANAQLGVAYDRLNEADKSAACAAEARKPPADDSWPDPYLLKAIGRRARRLQAYDLADFLMQRRQFEEAAGLLRRAVPANEHSRRPFMTLGRCELQLRHFDEAAAAFEAVLAAAPDDAGANYFLGAVRYYEAEALKEAGDAAAAAKYEEALRRAGQALEAKPDDPLAQLLRGSCLLRLGRRDEALEALGQAARGHQEISEARLAYGEALAEAGRADEARAEFRAAADLALDDQVRARARKALDRLGGAPRP
jgi:tetratricopeptide (TPR) repeat protein